MSWDYQEYCDVVAVEAAGFAAAIKGADPATPVPTCPGWTLADLIEHHGRSERRVEYVVRNLSQEPVWSKDVPADLPDEQVAYAEWFAAGVQPLLQTLRAADHEAPMWTRGEDKHVSYWARRILYEAVVHRADAEFALGLDPVIDARTGADGVDEFLTNLLDFPWVVDQQRELNSDGQTVHLHATDHDADWLITLGREGFTWRRGTGGATVSAEGAAGDLLLLVYGRLKPTDNRFRIIGDSQLLADWLEKSEL
jgi:uncharacterized protein (TIGR03083 family)